MNENSETKAADSSGSQPPSGTPGARKLLSWLGLIVACVLSALLIAYGISALTTSDEELLSEQTEQEAKQQDQVAPARRESRTTLPTSALPANPDQLKVEAEQVVLTLQQRYPNQAPALHVAAMMYVQFRKSAEAEQLWKKCIDLSPNDARYYLNYAAVAMDRGNSEIAAETLQKAVDRGISSPDLVHHLGVALTNIGKFEEAEKAIEPTLKSNPLLATHWLVLGQAQLKQRKMEEAKQSLEKAVELGHSSPAAYSALATIAAQEGDEEKVTKYRELAADSPEGSGLSTREQFHVQTAAEVRGATVSTLIEAATVHTMMGNSLEAEQLLLRAITLNPSSSESCQVLAELYRAAGMPLEERLVRQRLVDINPFELVNHLNLAQAARDSGQPELAEAALKFAISVQPMAAEGYLAMAQLHFESEYPEKARWYAQEAVRRNPTTEGYFLLSSICQQMGDQAAASAAIEEAKKLASE